MLLPIKFSNKQHIFVKIASFDIWIVSGAIFAGMLSERLLLPAILVSLLAGWVRWMATGSLTRRTFFDWPVILLILMLPVTCWVTAIPAITLPQVYRLLNGIALLYTLVNWITSIARLRFIVLGMIALGLVLAIYGLFNVEWAAWKVPFVPDVIYEYIPRFRLEIIHRNVMAVFLVMLLPLSCAWLLFAPGVGSRWERWLVAIAAGMTLIVLFLTQGRAAWVAFGVVFLLFVSLRWKWGWLTLVFIALAVTGGILFGGQAVEAYQRSIMQDISIRVEIWSRAVAMIRDFPLTGVGMGTFNAVANALYPFFYVSPEYSVTPHAHNLLLQVGVDLGVPGLIAWLSIWLGVLTSGWLVYRWGTSNHDRWAAGLGAGIMGSQVAIMVHGITDANTWGMIRPAPIVWGLWGVAAAAAWIYCSRPAPDEEIQENLPAAG